KNTWHSLELTRRLPELVGTGWPVLVAASNKDFIGEALDLPAGERLEGTLATLAVSAWLGARVFRVHQVRPARRALDMVAAIRGPPPPAGRPPRPGLTGRVAVGPPARRPDRRLRPAGARPLLPGSNSPPTASRRAGCRVDA